MDIFRSYWVLALLALIVNVGTFTVAFMNGKSAVMSAWPKPEPVRDPTQKSPHVPFWDFSTTQIESLIDDLQAEKTRLEEREMAISKIETRVDAERREVARLKQEIETYQDELIDRITRVEESEARNLKTLADTYTGMPPEMVVSVFEEMDDYFVAKLLSLMNTETVSGIFEQMVARGNNDPAKVRRVASLSERLRLLEKQKK
ncbi:MAG: hypothetical protein MK080_04190 [Opitutales bacterium]|nr:hypothetical protein [Opitutales bacterium]NRA26885.1 hypothetical protein [Opitutales bacterium]